MISILDRIGRPLQRLASLALMCAVVWFCLRFGAVVIDGMERWAAGEGVDLAGLAQLLTAFAAILGVVIIHIVALFRDRRIERVEEIRAGGGSPQNGPFGTGRPASPPASSNASPALDPNDPANSPRPAENSA
ncbi:MAG: hypothetical protein KJZ75_11095 [Hyphomonadaceae bacterium]|nr:hypothetical protein [Hyphomonadaceae bacterium]